MTMEEKNIKSDTQKIVIFKLGQEEFGVDISQVNRIIKMGTITRIPNTPPYILGVINLRGGIIVIFDLAMKLGFPSKPPDKNTRIIDIEIKGTIVGMVVDSATELLSIKQENIKPAPDLISKKINGDYLTAVAILENRILILLDLTKLLNSDEIQNLSLIKEAGESIHNIKKEKTKSPDQQKHMSSIPKPNTQEQTPKKEAAPEKKPDNPKTIQPHTPMHQEHPMP